MFSFYNMLFIGAEAQPGISKGKGRREVSKHRRGKSFGVQ